MSTGDGQERHVICGASNFAVGDRVALAVPGAVLPGGFEIGARKTYGRISEGMICSAAELAIGDDHSGIMVLPADAPLGTDFVSYAACATSCSTSTSRRTRDSRCPCEAWPGSWRSPTRCRTPRRFAQACLSVLPAGRAAPAVQTPEQRLQGSKTELLC